METVRVDVKVWLRPNDDGWASLVVQADDSEPVAYALTGPYILPQKFGRGEVDSMPNENAAHLIALAYAGGAADALRYQSEQIRFQAGLPSIFDGDDAEEDAEDGA